jgi:hypothetical protein
MIELTDEQLKATAKYLEQLDQVENSTWLVDKFDEIDRRLAALERAADHSTARAEGDANA